MSGSGVVVRLACTKSPAKCMVALSAQGGESHHHAHPPRHGEGCSLNPDPPTPVPRPLLLVELAVVTGRGYGEGKLGTVPECR